ncbi:MAG: helix-turn-helix domain-containing protein [Ruminococcus flavefaciens]|nr:helix-turn-helix domain-containing protein [Ruminococcus flavefaciens]
MRSKKPKRTEKNSLVVSMGQHVMAYRQEHNMSKAQFARECGVSEGFLRRLENGEANPTLDLIEKLADFIGVPPVEFIYPPAPKSEG